MRSSEWVSWRTCLLWSASACVGLLFAACSVPNPPASAPTPATLSAGITCVDTDAKSQPVDSTLLSALQRSVEIGPLYATASAGSGVAACRIEHRSGAITLRYDFMNGGRVQGTRDARIEYSEQVARLVSPPAGSAVELLARAERMAFGVNGCGMDWRQPETRTTQAEVGATDTVFRGEVCNCQGRIRTNASGGVVELAFKSAC